MDQSQGRTSPPQATLPPQPPSAAAAGPIADPDAARPAAQPRDAGAPSGTAPLAPPPGWPFSGSVIDQSVPSGPGGGADAAEAVPQWLEEVGVRGFVLARFLLPGAAGGVVAVEDSAGSGGDVRELAAGISYDVVVSAYRVRPAACRALCVRCALLMPKRCTWELRHGVWVMLGMCCTGLLAVHAGAPCVIA